MSCSWLGMLPGTWAYVSAGAFGRAIIVSSPPPPPSLFWLIPPIIWFPTYAYDFTIIFFLIFQQEESEVGLPGGNGQLLTLGLGLLFTALAAAYVTRLAKVISIFFLNFLDDQKCVSMIDELTLSYVLFHWLLFGTLSPEYIRVYVCICWGIVQFDF